ncbi:MAG: hypothetical protein FWB90_05050, partial [Fibromonadales bacterium]|nr:hypothetical protein [Fibromonadales bacterium]
MNRTKSILAVAGLALALTLTSCGTHDPLSDPDNPVNGDNDVVTSSSSGGGTSSNRVSSSSRINTSSSSSINCTGTVINNTYLECANWTLGVEGEAIEYRISTTLAVPNEKVLTILPGTTIIFPEAGAGITVAEGGTIKAKGTALAPITLTKSALNWKSITINSTMNNEIEYVNMIGGGSGGNAHDAMLYLNNATVSITNSTFDGSASNSITIHGPSTALTAFDNNTFKNSVKAPIYVRGGYYEETGDIFVLKDIGRNNQFESNTENYIHIANSQAITNNMIIKKMPVPWRIDINLNVTETAKLTVEPGVEIVFGNASSGIYIGADASLSMIGTPTERISLHGIGNTKGSWGNIEIRSINTENKIDYVDMLNGGSGTRDYNAMIFLGSASVSITNSIIDGSATNGIALERANTILTAFDGNIIKNSSKAPIHIREDGSYSGSFYALKNVTSNNEFAGNTDDYIHVAGSHPIEADMTIKKFDVPWRIDVNLSISGTAKLTVEPG